MGNSKDVSIQEAAAMLGGSDEILILCHQKPDGDTLGSGFALFYALKSLGKTVRIACPDGFPARYNFMYPQFDDAAQPQFAPRLVVAVDIADMQLLGDMAQTYRDSVALCIDHHPSNTRYAANLLLNPKAAGTVEVIHAVICAMGVTPDQKMALCIYTGLTTDTGCFRYSNVTADTHRLAAKMIETGIDSYFVNKLMFETKSVARMEIERLVMDTLEYYYDNRFAVIVISQEVVERTGVPDEELEGISAIPRQIEGVEVSVTLRQKGAEKYRVSMRSGERIDSSAICAKLGGGGHARAAGCTLDGTLAEVKAQLAEVLRDQFS